MLVCVNIIDVVRRKYLVFDALVGYEEGRLYVSEDMDLTGLLVEVEFGEGEKMVRPFRVHDEFRGVLSALGGGDDFLADQESRGCATLCESYFIMLTQGVGVRVTSLEHGTLTQGDVELTFYKTMEGIVPCNVVAPYASATVIGELLARHGLCDDAADMEGMRFSPLGDRGYRVLAPRVVRVGD